MVNIFNNPWDKERQGKFGSFYYGGPPAGMNTRPRYEYGAGLSGGAGYETWGTPNNAQNFQRRVDVPSIFNVSGGIPSTPANIADPRTAAEIPRPPNYSGGMTPYPKPVNFPTPMVSPPQQPLHQGPAGFTPSTTPFGPYGFTGGGGGRVIVPWTNTVTGQTWNAPSTGYLPPSGDWQETGRLEGRKPVKFLSKGK